MARARGLRVATLDETVRYARPELDRRGLLPAMSGAAGWALGNVAPKSVSNTVVGNTGTSLAFGTSPSVTAGDVIIASSLWLTAGAVTPTFTDTASNVTTWNTAGNFTNNATVGLAVAISWGIATATGACTPKVTWADAASTVMELFIGDFVSPGGTVTQDGAMASGANTGSVTAITTPTGAGTGGNDLVINMIGCGGSFSAFGGAWTAMGPSTGDDAGYELNAAGNVVANATQTAGGYLSIIVAVQATGVRAFAPGRMPLGV